MGDLRWLTQPSGGPTWPDGPAWLQWLDRQKRRPIIAHPLGAALVTWVFSWFWPVTAGVAAVLLAEGVNQYLKTTLHQYTPDTWKREVARRFGLAIIGAELVVWWVFR